MSVRKRVSSKPVLKILYCPNCQQGTNIVISTQMECPHCGRERKELSFYDLGPLPDISHELEGNHLTEPVVVSTEPLPPDVEALIASVQQRLIR
ncbi:MAG: hypothetical protein ACRDFQ_01465 [Anaerolineales bacterium]